MRIKEIQSRIGTEQDGVWGAKSRAAVKRHLLSLMPSHNPWPDSTERALRAYYGDPGDALNLTAIPVSGLGVKYCGKNVSSITCHKKVSDSLLEILTEISNSPDRKLLENYAGVYNPRRIRGGKAWSVHAWGAAIDIEPTLNGNRTPWPAIATMPLTVMEAFARHGWTAAGAFWGRDAMHFEATAP